VANSNAALTVVPRLAVKTNGLRSAKLAQAYQTKLATTGGVQPVAWRMVGGKLAPGISLSQKNGTIAGTRAGTEASRVTLEARDALGAKSQKKLVLLVKA
jgi:Putative Ig domain